MNNLNSFINEIVEIQKTEQIDIQEAALSIPADIVLDGIDLIATVQAPA